MVLTRHPPSTARAGAAGDCYYEHADFADYTETLELTKYIPLRDIVMPGCLLGGAVGIVSGDA
jgi:hypothetical protein